MQSSIYTECSSNVCRQNIIVLEKFWSAVTVYSSNEAKIVTLTAFYLRQNLNIPQNEYCWSQKLD